MKKNKNTVEEVVPGLVYEYTPEEAEELGAFFDPAAAELSINELEEEIEEATKNETE